MPVVSSLLFVVALVLAVALGPQTRAWTWGPALIPLGMALLAAMPALWGKGGPRTAGRIVVVGVLTCGWFGWRAWVSPVAEFAHADLLLLAGAVGAFLVIRAIQGHAVAERVFLWGLALLLLANLWVMARQIGDPAFSPIFPSRAGIWASGFFAHYNEGANFLIGSSFVVGAAAWLGPHGRIERLIWALIALAGLGAVYFTHSRGGILAVAVGGGVCFALALIMGKRGGARWFAPALVAMPVIAALLLVFVYQGWTAAQEVRSMTVDVLTDNALRLSLMGIAVSTMAEHPWAGGGSGSFSWEVMRHWRPELHGLGGTRPEQVHNEFLQAATDYGLVGAGLLGTLLGAVLVGVILLGLFENKRALAEGGNSWLLGGIAGLAGMFVQSSFSFVFHLLPGAILLGVCLGRATWKAPAAVAGAGSRPAPAGVVLAAMAALLAVCLVPVGWRASRALVALWPAYFGGSGVSLAARHAALSEGLALWPTGRLYRDRGMLLQEIAAADLADLPQEEATRLALADYEEALARHPYDATSSINRANVLSVILRTAEAEEEYERAVSLQGGLEQAFRARFHRAWHYVRTGSRLLAAGNHPAALIAFQEAAEDVEQLKRELPHIFLYGDGRQLEAPVWEGIGNALEGMGEWRDALEAYEKSATMTGSERAHFFAVMLLQQIGKAAWDARKPSEGLAYFLRARERLASVAAPAGFTAEDKERVALYLEESINFLTEARVTPAELLPQ
jgi:tetratricopeptide (TPR) repeat protein